MVGAKSELEQIIGNAVPVKLGEFIGRAIKKADAKDALVTSPTKAVTYTRPFEPPTTRQPFFVFEQRSKYLSSNDGIVIERKPIKPQKSVKAKAEVHARRMRLLV